MFTRTAAGLLLMTFFACARPQARPLMASTQITVTVSPDAAGAWLVEYTFATPQAALVFDRSGGDYRTGAWTSLTPGVRLERLRGFDTLVFDVPSTHARFRVVPYSRSISPERTPWLRFSNADLAVYTGQFGLLPVRDRTAALALDGQIRNWRGQQPAVGVRVIQSGHRASETVLNGDGTYVYLGSQAVNEQPDYVGIIDDGLPDWIRASFATQLAEIFKMQRDLWGEGLPRKATMLLAFGGFDGHWLNQGAAMGSLVAMQVLGAEYRQPNDELAFDLVWFFAHEVTHLFQMRSGRTLADAADSWIIEGAADATAYRVLERMGEIDAHRRGVELERAYERCVWFLGQGPLREAKGRGQNKAHYDCGLVIAEATARSVRDGDYFAFWNALLGSGPGPTYDIERYLTVLGERGASAEVVSLIRTVVSAPSPAAVTALTKLKALALP